MEVQRGEYEGTAKGNFWSDRTVARDISGRHTTLYLLKPMELYAIKSDFYCT